MLRKVSAIMVNALKRTCAPRSIYPCGMRTACNSPAASPSPVCCPPESESSDEVIPVAINGMGRIGKCLMRLAFSRGINIVAVNQPFATSEMIAHSLKYDTVHGKYTGSVCANDGYLCINGKCVRLYHEQNPEKIPWKDTSVKYVIDATGKFTVQEALSKHLTAGAKKVVLTAPSKDVPMFVKGVNFDTLKNTLNVVSNASCTTNCAAPLIHLMNKKFGVNNCLLTTTHAVTSTQQVHDGLNYRSAYGNIVPSATGAAKAVGLVIPELKGKVDGDSARVPTLDVSLLKLYMNVKNEVTVEAIKSEIKTQAAGSMKGVVTYIDDQKYVSSDFLGSHYSSIVDFKQIQVIDKFVTISAWYDNEMGYANRVLDLIKHVMQVDR
ncbi:Glyceraldehyde 3-phosphate dehydrogenase, catalytic domain,Glyceraldehyde/Erythrose phosphate [Cinara cedri]|uniref:glyceraldehyde-3-phosphate dehydrogenase (NADP(+)) (phosphorylating) n=1 Tax=Cinara cedri TaxID=506608 RepID=A0A5E4NTJ4_9HEMI|nr:Glyceraldehyde 3-phosphate dehydrogenase, catalytic domain,Glyceraldehyde/Erythrose phosphate [Cinara cedri]